MAFTLKGPREWSLMRDDEGYRTYKLTNFVVTNNPLDGPYLALQTPGLPLPGSQWSIGNDIDPWVWCRPDATVKPMVTKEPGKWFEVTMTFSNKPLPKDKQKCQDQQVEDPLLEPYKISGSFTTKSEEATHDRYGNLIVNSAHEKIVGAPVEFEQTYPTVRIEQNVAQLNLPLLSYMNNKVNAFPLWGLQPRMIRCVIPNWERKFQGQCQVYYTRTLEFHVNYNGWDRDILDEGTKALHGKFNRITGNYELLPIGGLLPDRFNPQHFDRFLDRRGNPCKVVLDGHGRPSGVRVVSGTFGTSTMATITQQASDAAASVIDTQRFLTGFVNLLNSDISPQNTLAEHIPAWRNVSQTASRLEADYRNTVSLATALTTLTTSNAPANSINSATIALLTNFTAMLAALNAMGLAAVAARDADFGFDQAQARAVSASRQVTTEAAVTNARIFVLTNTVTAAMRRVELDVNLTGTGTGDISSISDPGTIHVEKYDEADFLLLGIPLVIG